MKLNTLKMLKSVQSKQHTNRASKNMHTNRLLNTQTTYNIHKIIHSQTHMVKDENIIEQGVSTQFWLDPEYTLLCWQFCNKYWIKLNIFPKLKALFCNKLGNNFILFPWFTFFISFAKRYIKMKSSLSLSCL